MIRRMGTVTYWCFMNCSNKLDHSLINPNQVRHMGNDMWDNPYDTERPLCISTTEGISIPMHTSGSKIQFRTRVPSREELATCPHITMTDQKPWNPEDVILGSVSRQQNQQSLSRYEIPIVTRESLLQQIYHRQTQYPSEGTMDVPDKRTFISKDRHPNVTPEILANCFGIGLKHAMATITATTQ